MPAIGGSLESITLAGRIFAATADAEVQRKLGGFENEVQANGDGTTRTVKTRVPWSLSGVVVESDDSRGDQEFLQELADGNENFAVSATYASGETYQGTGAVAGELQVSNQSASAAFDLMGPGKLTPQ